MCNRHLFYNHTVICTSCHKAEAVVFIKQLQNHQLSQAALCASCAGQAQQQLVGADPLLKLLESYPSGRRASPECAECGTSYEEFRETGRFGCASCYDHFSAAVRSLLPRIHSGAYQHRGKSPRREAA